MPRIRDLSVIATAGAELVANSASDEAGLVPASEFALAADVSNVDNTADVDKPISTATQAELDLKAPLASPTFTGTVAGITKSMVGLGDVDNTSDADKPISDLTQAALDDKQNSDADLTAIAGLSPTNDDLIQRKAGAWTNRTPTQVTADLIAFVGDSGSGGTKGLVPAPVTGDAVRYLKGDGTWDTPAGTGSGDASGPASAVDSNLAAFDGTTGKLLKDSGVSASSFQTADTTLTALAAYNTNGLLTQTAADTFAGRTITGTSNEIDVSNGNGVSGNPTLSLPTVAKAYGKQAVWIPAGAMKARTTNGAAAGSTEMTTNKDMVVTLDFDTSTQEFAQFSIAMPKSWNESTVTFVPHWSHASTTTNFGVVWSLAGVAVSNDDALDVAFGTAQTSTDTGGTTNDYYAGPESSAITIAGTPAENDLVMFQVARVPSDGSDTLAVDARLHGITLYITTNAGNDA